MLSWCSRLSRSPHTRKVPSSNLGESILPFLRSFFTLFVLYYITHCYHHATQAPGGKAGAGRGKELALSVVLYICCVQHAASLAYTTAEHYPWWQYAPGVARCHPQCCSLARIFHHSSACLQRSTCGGVSGSRPEQHIQHAAFQLVALRKLVMLMHITPACPLAPLLHWGNALLLLHSLLDALDGVSGLNVNLNFFACAQHTGEGKCTVMYVLPCVQPSISVVLVMCMSACNHSALVSST